METKHQITSYILQLLKGEDVDQIIIEDDSFVVELSRHSADGFWKRGARLVGLLLVCLIVISFVVYGLVFFSKNVLFYRGELNTNQFGAFTPRKTYSSEYAMYLFDASEQWMNSGIQVQQGDELFISASGAFHTNCRELVKAATENTKATSLYMEASRKDTTKTDTVCLRWISVNPGGISNNIHTIEYGDHTFDLDTLNRKYAGSFNFGDVLFQVIPEYQISNAAYDDTTRIRKLPSVSSQLDKRIPITIEHDGVLAFMVNDRKPQNNIGQILVVMEIFRQAESWNKDNWYRLAYRWLDFPYFHYEYLRHKGYRLEALVIFLLLTSIELLLFCLVAYIFPFILYYFVYILCHPRKEFLRLKAYIKKVFKKS